jgi:hypothetical protein
MTGSLVTVHGPHRLIHCYCNIQECVTGKSVTVHGPYGVMYCYCNIQECTFLYIIIIMD